MTAFILKTDINKLCFEKFYWGHLIDSKVSSTNLIKQELLWSQIASNYIKLSLDKCLGCELNFLLFR